MIKFFSKPIAWWVFIAITIVATVIPLPSAGGYGFSYAHNAMVLVAIALSLASMIFVKELKLDVGFFALLSIVTLLFAPSLWTDSSMSTVILRYSCVVITLFWVFLLPDLYCNQSQLTLVRSILVLIFVQALFALILYFVLIPASVLSIGGNRVTGIFMQPNVLASFLASGAVLAGYLYCTDTERWAKKLAAISLMLLPAVIVLIESKAGLLGMLVGLLMLFVASGLLKLRKWKQMLGFLVLGIFVGLYIQYIDINFLDGQQRAMASHVSGSQSRLGFYIQSLQMISSNPLGVGFGKFAYAFMESWLFDLNPYLEGQSIGANLFHPHNEILFVGVEGGLVSLLAIALLVGYVLRRALSVQPIGWFLLKSALLCPILIHAMLEFPFYHSFLHWIIFILFVRILMGPQPSRSISKIYPITIGFLLLVFAISGMHTNYQLNQFRQSMNKNRSALGEIINPWVLKDELDYTLQVTSLDAAIELRMEDLVRSELEQAYMVVQVIPQANLFTNMIRAHLLLGEVQEAEKLLMFVNRVYLKDLGREGNPVELTEFDIEQVQ